MADDWDQFQKVEDVDPWEQFAVADAKQAKYKDVPPEVQTAIRSTAKGLFSPVAFFSDAVASLYNLPAKGVNTLTGERTLPYIPSAESGLNAVLDKAGINPQAASLPEKMVTGALGALTGSGLAGSIPAAAETSLPMAAQYIKSLLGGNVVANVSGAAAAPAGAEIGGAVADKFGLEGAPHTAAEVIGSVLGGTVGSATGNTGAGMLRRGSDLLHDGGWDRAAGVVLNKLSSAPETSKARLLNADLLKEELPGSRKTLAEVTQDPGLARAQRTMTSSPIAIDAGVDQVNAIRQAQQDAAITRSLNIANGIGSATRRDRLDRVSEIKQRLGDQWNKDVSYSGINLSHLPVDMSKTEAVLAELRGKYQGNDAVTDMIDRMSKTFSLNKDGPIEGVFNGAGVTPFNPNRFAEVWGRRQSLDDIVFEKLLQAAPGESRWSIKSAGQNLRTAMNDDLKAAANANGLPFEKFLQDYSKAVTTEQAMKAGRDIAKKVQNSARNIPMDETLKYGDRTLSGAKLDKLDTDFEEARRGIDFTRLQEKAIHGAQEDKRVSNILATGGAPGNSQTGQNLAMDTLLSHYLVDSLMGDRKGGVARQATRSVLSAPMTWANKVIGKPARDEILRRVAKGMLDPEEARRLMTLGDLTSGVTFGDSLKGGLVGEITRRATQ